MQQLKQFQAVAREENISRAAEKLNMAQPALSTAVNRLEKELGTQLFDRAGKKIQLNQCGKAYLAHVDRMLVYWENAQKELEVLQQVTDNKIVIGATSFMATQQMLYQYKDYHPELELSQYNILLSDIPGHLKSGNCHFIISTIDVDDPEVGASLLLTQEIGLIVPVDHPFSKRNSIVLSEAQSEKFVSMPLGYAYRETTDTLCRKAGFEPKIVMEYFHSQIIDVVSRGVGVALGIRYPQREAYFNTVVRFIPITDPICRRNVWLLWLKDRYLPPLAEEFLRFATNYNHP